MRKPAPVPEVALQTDRLPRDLTSPATLGVFAILGAAVALAEWGILPDTARIVGAPALAAAMLLDTFLYNEFLIRTGSWIWLEIFAFLYVQAVVVGAVVRRVGRYWRENAA